MTPTIPIPIPVMVLASVLVLAAGAPSARDDVSDLNDRARAAMDAGRAQEAVDLLEEARRLSPSEPVLGKNLAYAYFLRARQQIARVRFDAAVSDLTRAIELNPDEPGYRVHLAQLHLRRYRLDDAERVARAALAVDDGNADAWVMLGDALNLSGRLPEAVEAYRTADDVGSGEVAAHARALAERVARQHEVEKDYRDDDTEFFDIRSPMDVDGPLFGPRVASLLERARAEVNATLDTFPRQRTTVVLYTPQTFREVTGAHEWVGGLFDRKIRIPIGDVEAERERIEAAFRHEYTHLIVSELAPQCPTLVNEGLAQVMEFGRGTGMARLATWLDANGGRESTPHLADLPTTFIELTDGAQVHRAYLLSHAFVDHVQALHGMRDVMGWVRELASRPLDEAYLEATGRLLAQEEELFRERLRTWR